MNLFFRTKQLISYINFKRKYPRVKVINPLRVGTFYSQVGQDTFLFGLLFRKIINNNNNIIVDIGCNHPVNFSNSFFFEKYFNCKTYAFDPIAEYAELWHEIRPNAEFTPIAIGSGEQDLILNIPEANDKLDDMFSSLDKENIRLKSIKTTKRTIKSRPLTTVLDERNIKDILLVSIDVEGFEMNVLNGIDFDRTHISCFIIENNTKNLYGSDEIRDLLQSKGYVFKARILCFDDVFIHKSILGQVI